jgi:hypothetical protein
VTLLLAVHLTTQTAALPEVIKLGSYMLYNYIIFLCVETELRETEMDKDIAYCTAHLCIVHIFRVHVNPHQNDQGRNGPCFFQRLIALKCLKCQKI